MGRRTSSLKGPKARMCILQMVRSTWTWQQVHRLPLLKFSYRWVKNEVLSAYPSPSSIEDAP